MRQIVVGTFYLGHESCELVLREGSGAEFYTTPEPGHVARIKVGADDGDWPEIVARFLHEVAELSLHRAASRFRCTTDQTRDDAGFVFMFDHHTFSEVCSRVAEFATPALPRLADAWGAWNRKANPRPRRRAVSKKAKVKAK